MSPGALQQLAWCELVAEVVHGALWMPLGALDRAYSIEFSVAGRPHTFGLPTVYQWSALGRYPGARLQVQPDITTRSQVRRPRMAKF